MDLSTIGGLAKQPGAAEALNDAEQLGDLVFDVAHKDGVRTSEFWLTLGISVAGASIAACQVWQGKLDMNGAALFMSGVLGVATYVHNRTKIKTAGATPLAAVAKEGS